jgi:hypothetical protein
MHPYALPHGHQPLESSSLNRFSNVQHVEHTQAGFEAINIEVPRIYNIKDVREFLSAVGIDADAIAHKVQDKFISAFVRARKPEKAASCCGPTCCNT